ncbi:hypothetical protein LJ756_01130 [Arthrobacter sp. zg-Y411]|uniref:hypothetical protein n=1 Tax=Arthrobacter zhangbolii TaxID=2886936 RepID=UPI001D136F43|nr:hypothetical protein [Arthrobacter zhangbolii]MCC3293218.1 hypothetical protein [Arthrobacter zhangbolii]
MASDVGGAIWLPLLIALMVGFGSQSIGLWGGNRIIDTLYVIVVAAAVGFDVVRLPVSRSPGAPWPT